MKHSTLETPKDGKFLFALFTIKYIFTKKYGLGHFACGDDVYLKIDSWIDLNRYIQKGGSGLSVH